MKQNNNILTISIIGAIAWAISNAGHEIIGHGLVCISLGYEALSVSTSFFIYDDMLVSFWDKKFITFGGIFYNICISLVTFKLLEKTFFKSIHTNYFIWILMSFNIFYSGSYIMGWFFGPTLDSSLLLVGFENQIMLKVLFIVFGFSIIIIGMFASSKFLSLFIESTDPNKNKKITILTFYPYLAAIVIKISAGMMNQDADKILVILGSFGATGFFLIWINFIRFWPNIQLNKGGIPNLTYNSKWVYSGIIILYLYIIILGSGIKL